MRSWTTFALFLAVMTLFVGGFHYYLYYRLVRGLELEAWMRIGSYLVLASAILLPAGMFASNLLSRPLASWMGLATFGWMGFVVLLIFLTLGSEPLRGIATLLDWTHLVRFDDERRVLLQRGLGGFIGLAALGLSGYGLSAARDIQIKKVPISLERFPGKLAGFRIVQLSDLHIGPTIDGVWLRDVVARTNAEEPDLIAITGDLVDGSVEQLAAQVAPLADLRAKYGVFFVTGNHEYYSGVDAWIAELERLGVRVLRNERVSIGEGDDSFDLAGIDDYRAKSFGNGHGADLEKALGGRDETRELVLLAHQPKHAMQAEPYGVGLQLSGHTHGGQIFPWGFFVRLDQTFLAGLERLGKMQIYTSCGTGYWGPPMRVGATPEITVLELSNPSASG